MVVVFPSGSPPEPADVERCRELLERRDLELVLVNDGGNIETRTALQGLRGDVRILHLPQAVGSAMALGHGTDLTSAPIVVQVPDGTTAVLEALDAWVAPLRDDPELERAAPPDDERLARGAPVPGAPVPSAPVPGAPVTTAVRRQALGAWNGGVPRRLAWRPPRLPRTLRPGLNVIGLLEAANGIGEAGRRYADAASGAGVAVATFPYHAHLSPPAPHRRQGGEVLGHDTNLVVLNPELLKSLALYAGAETWLDRYVIGVWFWELEQLSPGHLDAFPLVHELWAPTEFLRKALAAHTDRPVLRVPLPVPHRSGPPRVPRASVGLTDRFTFLSTFDFGSLAERKNSLGIVEAFRRAFRPGEGPVLSIKTLGAGRDAGGWAALRQAIAGRPDIRVVDTLLSEEEFACMIGHAECYVSLHRAEGFGLNPAEAMAWGRPVIATGYSGNLDFMTEENSYLVPFDLVPVPPHLHHVYPAGSRWAEPRLQVAIRLLRQVWEDQTAATARGLEGQRDIRRTNGPSVTGAAVRRRLAEIDARLGRRGPRRAAPVMARQAV